MFAAPRDEEVAMSDQERAALEVRDEELVEEIDRVGQHDDGKQDDDLAFEIFASRCPPTVM
jgi:hypothetical protein